MSQELDAGETGTTVPRESQEPHVRQRLDRRRFLALGSTSAAGVLAAGWHIEALAAPDPGKDQEKEQRKADKRAEHELKHAYKSKPSLALTLRRREDQVHLRFELFNLKVDGAEPGMLVRKKSKDDAHVVVVFPPQHIAEEALYEHDPDLAAHAPTPPTQDGADPGGTESDLPPPLGARLAGESRLAFRIPDTIASIPLTAAALMDWSAWEPSLVPVATGPRVARREAPGGVRPDPDAPPSRSRPPKLRPPTPIETALEVPRWLYLSPHAATGWVHAQDPVTHDGRTELWHTRFAGHGGDGTPDEDNVTNRVVRAVWARDPIFGDYLDDASLRSGVADGESFPRPDGGGMPFRTSLSPRDRFDIVTSSADHAHDITSPSYVPEVIDVDRLMLTSLGSWLDAEANFQAGFGKSEVPLESWRQRSTLGRDHYVRVVYKGYLMPFGHAASLIKVTERKFSTIGAGTRLSPKRRIAYLRQRYFIVVRQTTRTFGGVSYQPHVGRRFPFSKVVLTTRTTPTLDAPLKDFDTVAASDGFVPRRGTAPFHFKAYGIDAVGRRVDFTLPMAFVTDPTAFDVHDDDPNDLGDMVLLRGEYNSLPPDERTTDFQGAKVAVAPSDATGDTDLELGLLRWAVEAPTTSNATALNDIDQPGFFPILDEAEIRLAAVDATMGMAATDRPMVVYDDGYVTGGFGANPGQIFVRLADTDNPTAADFGGNAAGDRSGGLVTPNLGVTALSRKTGTVAGDPDEFQAGNFTPAKFFADNNPTLLGDIKLSDVIHFLTDFDPTDPEDIAKLLCLQTIELPDRIETSLDWRPELTNVGELFVPESDCELIIAAHIVTPLNDPANTTTRFSGELTNFQIGLVPGAQFIVVNFDAVRFVAEGGSKPDVDVEIREVLFVGALEFVNQLKDYLSFSSGGFEIALEPTGLRAGFQIPLPAITIGVFSLQNITFSAGITIPFTGQPMRMRFGFCSQDNPFVLTVMMFGGGGFFEISIGPDGVEALEAALEFGGNLSLDVGVASGGISLMAGIYFAIGLSNPPDNPDGAVELRGYVRLHGELCILGIISLSLTFEMTLTYLPEQEKAIGKAIMTVEIDLLIWSGSVEVEVERKFGGSDDPTFGQVLTEPQWHQYAAAFAPKQEAVA